MFVYVSLSIILQRDINVINILTRSFNELQIKINGSDQVNQDYIITMFEDAVDQRGPQIAHVLLLESSRFFDNENNIIFVFGESLTGPLSSSEILSRNEQVINLYPSANSSEKYNLTLNLNHFSTHVPRNLQSESFLMLDGSTKPILAGHRGLGSTFGKHNIFTGYTENTIRSFSRAHELGADMVELDVSITRDHCIVVYHDGAVIADGTITAISELSYDHVLEKQNVENNESGRLLHVGQCTGDQMELLQSVLEKTSQSLAINVEIKSTPMLVIDREYIAAITNALLAFPSRKFIISSFSHIICAIAAVIQGDVPVFLLVDKDGDVRKSAEFAHVQNLTGLVLESGLVLDDGDSDVVRTLKSEELRVFVWGDKNNDVDNIRRLVDLGVDGIINDRVDLLVKYGGN